MLGQKVERLFAHFKRFIGFGRLPLRGPCGTNDEFLVASQNLRKLADLFLALLQTQNVIKKSAHVYSVRHVMYPKNSMFPLNVPKANIASGTLCRFG